jgi:hypothetical protein
MKTLQDIILFDKEYSNNFHCYRCGIYYVGKEYPDFRKMSPEELLAVKLGNLDVFILACPDCFREVGANNAQRK